MESEVLSKHRKALMLFGLFHLLHGGRPGEGDERHYPGRTFVIGGLGYYGVAGEPLGVMTAPGGVWPSLLRTKDSKLGSLGLDAFSPSPIWVDGDCNVSDAFPSKPSEAFADRADAFLYLGPQNSSLTEPLPADIVLDRVYRSEWLRRMKLAGMPGPSTPEEMDVEIVASAADPLQRPAPRRPVSEEMKSTIRQDCLSKKHPDANRAK